MMLTANSRIHSSLEAKGKERSVSVEVPASCSDVQVDDDLEGYDDSRMPLPRMRPQG